MKIKNRAVKSFNFTKISCNLGFGNGIIQLWVVGHHKKRLYGLYSFADATRTPHGDGNYICVYIYLLLLDATRTPHGDGNLLKYPLSLNSPGCNPHPSRGRQRNSEHDSNNEHGRCNPHPSRGRQHVVAIAPITSEVKMQPAPLTGTATVPSQ